MGHIIFTNGHRIRAILRGPLPVHNKICGVTLIHLILLVFRTVDFFLFGLCSHRMASSLKTNIQSWDQMTFEFDISAAQCSHLTPKMAATLAQHQTLQCTAGRVDSNGTVWVLSHASKITFP